MTNEKWKFCELVASGFGYYKPEEPFTLWILQMQKMIQPDQTSNQFNVFMGFFF